ncbi:cysteine proteinase [Obba rivulosa]|uniref:Cysteine proteinase n=1 Tax=Obba rivulosa TaxID=1052685 RepID=A0A8E2DKK9_9APHY|nr:cysteine proteinase [Obba rivulosa]
MSSEWQKRFAEAEVKYNKAARAELEKDFDRAFQLYVNCAEDFLHLGRIISDVKTRNTAQTQASKALGRAEKIKAVKRDVAPAFKNHFSEQEQLYILRKSSSVHTTAFDIWDDTQSGGSDDTSHPDLSTEQKQKGAVWRRLPGSEYPVYSSTLPLLPQEIVQQVVADCSLCGSIAVCIEHHRRFQSKLGLSALYPQSQDLPDRSKSGTYSLRALFNGTYRRVTIDDRLPTFDDGTLMCVSTGFKKQLWPSLIEKAYMKLMGGYDFPGSNSGTDLHVLSGWIPEHIDLKRPDFQREKTWERVLQGFSDGKCVLTVGTGEKHMTIREPHISLLPAHCYAVLDLRDMDGERQIDILDTWSQLHSYGGSADGHTERHTKVSGVDRRFQLSWDETCSTFDTIYLSWDPKNFPHHLQFHGCWKPDDTRSGHARSCRFPLRLRVDSLPASAESSEVWILLTRHVRDIRNTTEFISLLVRSEDEFDQADYARRSVILNGEYTNDIHVLAKVKLRPETGQSTLSVITSYDGAYDEVGFTVTIYSHIPLSWVQESTSTKYSQQIDDSISRRNAGGNQTFSTFLVNPQYHLRIRPNQQHQIQGSRGNKAFLSLIAQSDRSMPINLLLIWSQGERVADPDHSSIIATSGPYSYGHAEITHHLPAGDYTLIVSAFEPRHVGEFSLQAGCSYPFELTRIPAEGAGMFCKVARGQWLAETAAGAPGFRNYRMNPSYELIVTSQTQVMMRLQLADSSPATPLNVTLFRPTQATSLGLHAATSGPYSDAVCGVVTPQITLQPGVYVVIPSTYNPGVERAFRLLVYSTNELEVAPARRT